MLRNQFLLVGIENRKSKQGKDYYMLHLSQAFTEPKYGTGSKTSVEYCSADNFPKEMKVGDTIELSYGRAFDGKAYVNGVDVVGDIPTVQTNKK